MRQLPFLVLALALMSCAAAPTSVHADWPHWRGPDGTGSAPDADTVESFNFDTGENVRWSTAMPGPSAATPIVVGDRIFTPAGTADTNRMLALGVDRKTGDILWKDDVGPARQSRSRSRENNHAECSPVADDKHVYFIFGSGDLVAYTHDGEKKWHTNLTEKYGKIEILWGYASSPLLIDGKLYIQILRRKPNSLLLRIDAATGEVEYAHQRPTEALGESFESYASPIAATIDDKTQIVIYGGDALTGHDPATGRELWRFEEGINPKRNKMFRVISGPTQGLNGLIYLTSPRGEDLLAIDVKNNTPQLKWYRENVDADVPCPVYHDGAVFVFSGAKKQVTKLNADTGQEIWTHRIDSAPYFRCTPTVADDKLYLINGEGELFILSASDEYQQLARINLGGYPTRASIAAVGKDIYIRTGDKLICAGKEHE